jgi:hypothetical protein
VFDAPCRFVLQLRQGRIVAAEADRQVSATLLGRRVELRAYVPVQLGGD